MDGTMKVSEPVVTEKPQRLPLLVKFVYGSGDWGLASFGTLRGFQILIFFTDVVGLDPRLASIAMLVGVLWDAINDPLIGRLSDRGRLVSRLVAKWGRRRPFLLLFAIPYGLSFLALWIAPPWNSQLALLVHVTLMYMLSDTLFTLVSLPFYAMTPELTPDYDERTSLVSARMVFNLISSLFTAVAAPDIIRSAPTLQQGYTQVGLIFGVIAALPFLAIFLVTRHMRFVEVPEHSPSLLQSFRAAWSNVPFRFATGIHLLNWVAVDLVALMLPFLITYWLERGDQSAQVLIPGLGRLSAESVLYGIFFGMAVVAVPLWLFVSRRLEKHTTYIVGLSFWLLVQVLFIALQPGQRVFAWILAFIGGIGVSTAHVLPDALFPDVMEWDELMTGERREGVYYGVRTFIRKSASAIAMAAAAWVLGLFGYQAPPEGAAVFQQPESALWAIRILTGPAGAVLVLGAIVVAFFYPLTRSRHRRVRLLLARREARLRLGTKHKVHPSRL